MLHLHSFQRLKAVGLGVALCLFGAALSVAPVAAQSPGSGNINVSPQNARFYRTASGDLVNRANVEALVKASYNTPAAGGGAGTRIKPSTYHTLKFPISPGTLGGLAKNAIKGGVYGYLAMEAIKSAIDTAGWAIDELQQQVTQPPTAETQPTGTIMYCAAPDGPLRCTTTLDGAKAIASIQFERCTQADFEIGGIFVRCRDGADGFFLAKREVTTPTPDYGSGSTETTVITNEELGRAIANSPVAANAVLSDPQTGVPHMTPELADAMNNLSQALAAREGMNANPITASPDPGTDPTLADAEWPDFCGWADRACQHMDWMEEPPPETEPVEMPFEELEIQPSTWSIGLGSGTCPADKMMTFQLHGTHNIPLSFEGICTAAGYLRPIVIASGLIIAALIIGGLRQNKGA